MSSARKTKLNPYQVTSCAPASSSDCTFRNLKIILVAGCLMIIAIAVCFPSSLVFLPAVIGLLIAYCTSGKPKTAVSIAGGYFGCVVTVFSVDLLLYSKATSFNLLNDDFLRPLIAKAFVCLGLLGAFLGSFAAIKLRDQLIPDKSDVVSSLTHETAPGTRSKVPESE